MARRPQSVAVPCHGRRDTGGLALSSSPGTASPCPLPGDTVAILTSGGPAQASCTQLRAHPAGATTHGATGELASGQPRAGTGCPNTPTPACTGTSRHCLILCRPPPREGPISVQVPIPSSRDPGTPPPRTLLLSQDHPHGSGGLFQLPTCSPPKRQLERRAPSPVRS